MSPEVRCWEAGPEEPLDDGTFRGTTCMLPDGHDGPHEFESDDLIEVRFVSGTRHR